MTGYEFDYSDYGIFNGKSTLTNYNRKERRKYIKEHKHNKNAKMCPNCNNKTIFITDDNGKQFCELCGKLYPTLTIKSEDRNYKPLGKIE